MQYFYYYDLTEFDVKINNDFLENIFLKLCECTKEKRKNFSINKITSDKLK